MADTSATSTFPRRDAEGRVISLAEMLAAALLGGVVAGLALVVIDAIIALIGLSGFGRSSGWLAAILPAFVFFDDVRAWRGYAVRFLVAAVALVVAIGVGLIAAGLPRGLPPIASGFIGTMVAAAVYAPIWFLSIRALTGVHPEEES
jgi:hypothetical protein